MNKTRVNKLVAMAAVIGLGLAASAQAALLIDVRATGLTGTGSITNGGKTVSMHEGDVVTFTTFINGVPGDGLDSFAMSLRSRGETFNVGQTPTAYASPTPTDTVLNADGSASTTNTTFLQFNSSSASKGSATDLATAVDGTDTDLDVKSVGDFNDAHTHGVGVSSEVALFRSTFTAFDGDDATRPFNRTVNVNTFGSGVSTSNGNASFLFYTSSADNTTTGSNVSATNFGTDVAVSVTPAPEPASLGLLGLAAAGLLRRRARRA